MYTCLFFKEEIHHFSPFLKVEFDAQNFMNTDKTIDVILSVSIFFEHLVISCFIDFPLSSSMCTFATKQGGEKIDMILRLKNGENQEQNFPCSFDVRMKYLKYS